MQALHQVRIGQEGAALAASPAYLAAVLPGVASSVGNMYVVYPSRRHVPRAVTVFVEMTVQRLAPLIQSPFTGAAVSA